MTAQATAGTARPALLGAVAIAAVAATAVALQVDRGGLLEAWFLVFVILAGLGAGSLGLLTVGHLMSEAWLAPIRRDVEAAALTIPLLALLGLPLALNLDRLYPWAGSGAGLDLPAGRAAFLDPAFFLARSAAYLALWSAVAAWVVFAKNVRLASAIGIAVLAPTMSLAACDWVLSREPQWWSTLFGFAFALSHLSAALAGAIVLALSRRSHPEAMRMQSLERALLTLALLALWAWFAQFLIVWLANLPDEVAWYLRRGRSLPWLGLALAALAIAVVMLVPSGVGRRTMIVGSVLILVQHVAHLAWIVRPAGALSATDAIIAALGGVLCGAWFIGMRRLIPARPVEQGD